MELYSPSNTVRIQVATSKTDHIPGGQNAGWPGEPKVCVQELQHLASQEPPWLSATTQRYTEIFLCPLNPPNEIP